MKNDEQTDYGKFGTAKALLDAYNALEAQFTKRCQLVSELQTALERSAQARGRDAQNIADGSEDGGDVNVDVAAAEPSDAAFDVSESDEGAPDTERQALTDEARQSGLAFDAVINEIAANADEYAEALSEVPEIFDACIARYKQMRMGGGHVCLSHGTAVLTPVKRPATLEEAKALTDRMLKRQPRR